MTGYDVKVCAAARCERRVPMFATAPTLDASSDPLRRGEVTTANSPRVSAALFRGLQQTMDGQGQKGLAPGPSPTRRLFLESAHR